MLALAGRFSVFGIWYIALIGVGLYAVGGVSKGRATAFAVTLWVLRVFPLFVWIGAGLLGWIAGDILAEDQALVERFGAETIDEVDFFTALGAAALVLGVGLWRRRSRRAV